VFLPRFVSRDLPFHQSSNLVKITNINQAKHLWKLVMIDWFHSLLRLPPYISITFLLSLWILLITIFASIYMYVDYINIHVDCGLGTIGSPIPFAGAFAFSLETQTTVGCKCIWHCMGNRIKNNMWIFCGLCD
jgi:hypothetical protein